MSEYIITNEQLYEYQKVHTPFDGLMFRENLVEVIRCRDCERSHTGEWCNYWGEYTEPNGFCHKAIGRCEDVSI